METLKKEGLIGLVSDESVERVASAVRNRHTIGNPTGDVYVYPGNENPDFSIVEEYAVRLAKKLNEYGIPVGVLAVRERPKQGYSVDLSYFLKKS